MEDSSLRLYARAQDFHTLTQHAKQEICDRGNLGALCNTSQDFPHLKAVSGHKYCSLNELGSWHVRDVELECFWRQLGLEDFVAYLDTFDANFEHNALVLFARGFDLLQLKKGAAGAMARNVRHLYGLCPAG